MDVTLVRVQTADGVRLDGALREPSSRGAPNLGIDLVICHHGHADNFYNPSFFDAVDDALLTQGCGVLRANSRGHDHVHNAGPRGKLGAAYEIVDDCRHDWRAWLDFAANAGYQHVVLWGHSLGAVKTIYYLAVESDARVKAAIASSPPRFSYATFASANERFRADIQRAKQLIADGQPQALVEAEVPLVTAFTAATYVDKYGPNARYDIFERLAHVRVPLLITLGGLENGLAFDALVDRGPSLEREHPNVSFASIADADHAYSQHEQDLWAVTHAWLERVTRAVPA